MDLFFALSNGALSVQTNIKRSAVLDMFRCTWLVSHTDALRRIDITKAHSELNFADRLQSKPSIDCRRIGL